jgi:hypothetical protein
MENQETPRQKNWRLNVKPVIDQYNRLIALGAANEVIQSYYEDMEEGKRNHSERFQVE